MLGLLFAVQVPWLIWSLGQGQDSDDLPKIANVDKGIPRLWLRWSGRDLQTCLWLTS